MTFLCYRTLWLSSSLSFWSLIISFLCNLGSTLFCLAHFWNNYFRNICWGKVIWFRLSVVTGFKTLTSHCDEDISEHYFKLKSLCSNRSSSQWFFLCFLNLELMILHWTQPEKYNWNKVKRIKTDLGAFPWSFFTDYRYIYWLRIFIYGKWGNKHLLANKGPFQISAPSRRNF